MTVLKTQGPCPERQRSFRTPYAVWSPIFYKLESALSSDAPPGVAQND